MSERGWFLWHRFCLELAERGATRPEMRLTQRHGDDEVILHLRYVDRARRRVQLAIAMPIEDLTHMGRVDGFYFAEILLGLLFHEDFQEVA